MKVEKKREDNKVSVIIPVYNTGKYLEKCISSVLNQTYSNLEVILIDDGSTDNSLKICNDCALKDSRILVLSHNNKGVSYTRNRGLDSMTGDYVTFVDSDDWIEKDYVEKLIMPIIKYNVQISSCNYDETNDNVTFKNRHMFSEGIVLYDRALDMLSEYYIGSVYAKLYSKESLIRSDGSKIRFNERLSICEDQLFWVEAVINAKKIYIMDLPLYHYFINNNGAMRTRDFNKYYIDFSARKEINALFKEYPKLLNSSLIIQTTIAAQAMSISEYSLNNAKMRELKEFISKNINSLLKCRKISLKEKIRAILVKSELTRKILYIVILKYKKISIRANAN